MMLKYAGYVGTVEAEDGAFAGRVLGMRDVVTFEADTLVDLGAAFRDSIEDYFAFCAERGELPDRLTMAGDRH